MPVPDAQYTDTGTAFRLTETPATGVAFPSTDPSQYGRRPLAVFLQAEDADIRFTTDGITTPTASVGLILEAGADPFLYVGNLIALQFIQADSGAKLNVAYADTVAATVGPQGAPGASAPGAIDLSAALAALGVYPDQYVDVFLGSAELNSSASVELVAAQPNVYVFPKYAIAQYLVGDAPFDCAISDFALVLRNGTAGQRWKGYNSFPFGSTGGAYPATNMVNQDIFVVDTEQVEVADNIGKPLILIGPNASVGDVTSLIHWRVYYGTATYAATLFFIVSDVDQGSNTFEVIGDASDLSGSIEVSRSTANDGTYTIASVTYLGEAFPIIAASAEDSSLTVSGNHVASFPIGENATITGGPNDGFVTPVVSATFGGVNTVIVLDTEFISDGPGGVIAGPNVTVIVVTEAIPSATADGVIGAA